MRDHITIPAGSTVEQCLAVQLTAEQWEVERETVAREIFKAEYPDVLDSDDPLETPESNAPHYYAPAEAAMTALGFRRLES